MYIDEKYNKILDLIYLIIQILGKEKYCRVGEQLLINNIDFLNSNYDIIVLLLKVSLRIEKNSKLLSLIRHIVVDKKQFVLIKDIDNNLLLFKYLQSVGYFVSYKKERPIHICWKEKNQVEREKLKCKRVQMTKRQDTKSPGRTLTLPQKGNLAFLPLRQDEWEA